MPKYLISQLEYVKRGWDPSRTPLGVVEAPDVKKAADLARDKFLPRQGTSLELRQVPGT